jgi:hypothetical protein
MFGDPVVQEELIVRDWKHVIEHSWKAFVRRRLKLNVAFPVPVVLIETGDAPLIYWLERPARRFGVNVDLRPRPWYSLCIETYEVCSVVMALCADRTFGR